MITTGNIDQLISTFLSGEATPDEAMLLEDWKLENSTNLNYYNSCVKIFEATSGNKTNTYTDTDAAWAKLKPQLTAAGNVKPLFNKNTYYLRIAASVIVLLGIAGIVSYLVKDKAGSSVTYTAENNTTTIKLEDGTSVTVAPHSALTSDAGFGKTNRTIRLKGSAYFVVTHSEALPLIIDAGKLFIKDIGTKFNVVTSANEDTVHVSVDEGVVQLSDNLNPELILNANQAAIYIKSSKQLKLQSKTTQSIHFNFINNKLIDVANKLSAAYNIPVELQSKSLEDCTITTQFTNETIETVLAVITETVGLSYEKTKNGFVITGEKCNK